MTRAHAQSEVIVTKTSPRTPSASKLVGCSVPGTTSLPIVARMAGTGVASAAAQRIVYSASAAIETGPYSALPVWANDATNGVDSLLSPVAATNGSGRAPAAVQPS